MTVRINKQKINLREKLAGVEDKVNFDEVVRGLGEYTGNVGIGTTSPEHQLHIKNDSGVGDFKIEGTQPRIWLNETDQTDLNSLIRNNNSRFQIDTVGDEDEGIANRFTILNTNGNVGIGTTNPSRLLTLSGTGATLFSLVSTNDDNCQLLFGDSVSDTVGKIVYRHTSDSMAFETYAEERMRITSAGNVGIGTTNPINDLVVFRDKEQTSIGFVSRIQSQVKVLTTNRGCDIATYRATSAQEYTGVILQSRENGTINYLYHDNLGVLRTTTDGSHVGTTNGGAVGAQTSDERLKNIEDDFEYGLSHVLQLQPIAYTQKDDANRKLGFGAQTTQKIIPESVFDTGDCIDGYYVDPEDEMNQTPRSDNTRLGMEYVQLIPVLTKAIQEQQTIIEDLKSRIETLEQ